MTDPARQSRPTDANLTPAQPAPTRALPLSRGEAAGLLALADFGRAALDADPRLLRAPGQRAAAARALRRLRTLHSGT